MDVRLIAATKVDLKTLVDKGLFREDLFYRLNVINLKIPNLNQRQADIPILAHYFLAKANSQKQLSPDLQNYLTELEWPGNVRELEHLILQMSIFSRKDVIDLDDLPEAYRKQEGHQVDDSTATLTDRLQTFEANILKEYMAEYQDNQHKVAQALGIPRTTLRSKLMKHGLLDPSIE